MTNKAFIKSLHGVRGLAALMVVLCHLNNAYSQTYNITFLKNGYIFVDLFFVLSGFVIYHNYADKIKTFKSLMRFQLLRLVRIYPLHIAFLLIFLCLEFFRRSPFATNDFQAFLENLFLIQAIVPTGNIITFNSPSWSLSVELFLYAMFGAIALFSGRLFIPIAVVICVLSLYALSFGESTGVHHLLRGTSGFFAGVIVAILKDKSLLKVFAIPPLFIVGVIIFLLLEGLEQERAFVITILFFLLIGGLLNKPNSSISKILETRLFVWLGSISFSLYMSHMLVLIIGSFALRFPFFIQFNLAVFMFVNFAACLAVGHLVFRVFDKPVHSGLRKVLCKSGGRG